MTSRITIEVDFDNGKPYIKINEDRASDDVKDKLITFFRQQLHTSSWCGVEFFDQSEVGNKLIWRIRPIGNDILEAQAIRMMEQARLNKNFLPTPEGHVQRPGYDLTRRNILDQMEPAEKAIHDAMQEVEKMPADIMLTKAVTILFEAKQIVSDFIDKRIREEKF